MTTAASARLGHDEIVVGCDLAFAVIIEPIAGQTAAEVTTALGAGADASVEIVDTNYDFGAEGDAATAQVIADLSEYAEIDADARTLTIAVDAETSGDLFDGVSGLYVWRIVVTTSTGTGALKWPLRMSRVAVRPL
jgi:hypothetical protein